MSYTILPFTAPYTSQAQDAVPPPPGFGYHHPHRYRFPLNKSYKYYQLESPFYRHSASNYILDVLKYTDKTKSRESKSMRR